MADKSDRSSFEGSRLPQGTAVIATIVVILCIGVVLIVHGLK